MSRNQARRSTARRPRREPRPSTNANRFAALSLALVAVLIVGIAIGSAMGDDSPETKPAPVADATTPPESNSPEPEQDRKLEPVQTPLPSKESEPEKKPEPVRTSPPREIEKIEPPKIEKAEPPKPKAKPRKSTWTHKELDLVWFATLCEKPNAVVHRNLIDPPFTAKKRRLIAAMGRAENAAMKSKECLSMRDPEEANRLIWFAFNQWTEFRKAVGLAPVPLTTVLGSKGQAKIQAWRAGTAHTKLGFR